MNVYLLWHSHDDADGNVDDKLIGVYLTEEKARVALARTKELPGFRDFPDGFEISPYQVNKDHWTEGFETV